MDAGQPKGGRAGGRAGRGGKRRDGAAAGKRSLHLTISAEQHTRFRGLVALTGRAAGDLVEEWIREKTRGMRFSMPGVKGVGDDEGPADAA